MYGNEDTASQEAERTNEAEGKSDHHGSHPDHITLDVGLWGLSHFKITVLFRTQSHEMCSAFNPAGRRYRLIFVVISSQTRLLKEAADVIVLTGGSVELFLVNDQSLKESLLNQRM